MTSTLDGRRPAARAAGVPESLPSDSCGWCGITHSPPSAVSAAFSPPMGNGPDNWPPRAGRARRLQSQCTRERGQQRRRAHPPRRHDRRRRFRQRRSVDRERLRVNTLACSHACSGTGFRRGGGAGEWDETQAAMPLRTMLSRSWRALHPSRLAMRETSATTVATSPGRRLVITLSTLRFDCRAMASRTLCTLSPRPRPTFSTPAPRPVLSM